VLDEATSTLDAETERIITETLDSLAGDATLIVIAHRLATVRHCDQVIHLVGGSLGEGALRKSERRCRKSTGRRSCWGFKAGWGVAPSGATPQLPVIRVSQGCEAYWFGCGKFHWK